MCTEDYATEIGTRTETVGEDAERDDSILHQLLSLAAARRQTSQAGTASASNKVPLITDGWDLTGTAGEGHRMHTAEGGGEANFRGVVPGRVEVLGKDMHMAEDISQRHAQHHAQHHAQRHAQHHAQHPPPYPRALPPADGEPPLDHVQPHASGAGEVRMEDDAREGIPEEELMAMLSSSAQQPEVRQMAPVEDFDMLVEQQLADLDARDVTAARFKP